jgi:hypothetical protein
MESPDSIRIAWEGEMYLAPTAQSIEFEWILHLVGYFATE